METNTIRISDLFTDTVVVLKDDGKYYELWVTGEEIIDGWGMPVVNFVEKGKRIYKKDLRNLE